MNKLKCEMNYYKSGHLSQIYAGFRLLEKKGVLNIKINKEIENPSPNIIPILIVIVNSKIRIAFDVSDGIDWLIGESREKNIEFFIKNIHVDYYFKRSCNDEFFNRLKGIAKVYPLGLNYKMKSFFNFEEFLVNKAKSIIDFPVFNNLIKFNNDSFSSEYFENYPVVNDVNKILFFTRLWNPNVECENDEIKKERIEINEMRIDCIKTCKLEFGSNFLGGLQENAYALKLIPELVAPRSFTSRKSYIKQVKETNICISTTGLHGSIGWKFGEYVAASRAIISEPLQYQLPGEFKKDKNYLIFNDKHDLIDNIKVLLNNKDRLQEMIFNNYNYYQSFVKPDMLVLNALICID